MLDPANITDRTKMNVIKFAAGSAEDWLKLLKDVNAIITVKKWTTNAVAQCSMLQLLLKDEAKAVQYARQPRRYDCRKCHGRPIAHD
jgi:nitrate reductase cytochrome c-type subunit